MEQWKHQSIESSLDDKDWILLEAVQADARLSFAELGRRAGLSAPAAAERLRRLEDARIISGYHAAVEPASLGLEMQVWIEARVKRADYARIERAILEVPWILECHHVTGPAAYLIKAAVPDTGSLEQLIGHLSQYGETTTSLVLSTMLSNRRFSGPPRREA